MLAHPLEDADVAALDPAEWRAEWKWDGIRVQLTAGPGGRRIWSRGGEDVSGAFPEIAEAMDFHAVLDGELLVIRENGAVAPFADLQQRLNRKAVTPKMQRDFPVGVRLYDLLLDGNEDLRPLPFDERRRAAGGLDGARPPGADGPLGAHRLRLLRAARGDPRRRPRRLHRGADAEARGQPLRRRPREGAVVEVEARPALGRRGDDVRAARPREALAPSTATTPSACGARTGQGGEELVPVGKAYSGYTDQELVWLDRWIRNHTVSRFGPVREVEKSLVLEVIFDAAQLSNRHKSGVALRFPRILRIRKDKPASEADRLENLMNLVEKGSAAAADEAAD